MTIDDQAREHRQQASAEDRGGPRIGDVAGIVVAVLALLAGLAMAAVPYQRPLRGFLDGTPDLVAAECPAPIVGVFADGSHLLDEEGGWSAEPPCQRSSAYRLAFGGLLLAGGAAGGASVWRRTLRRRAA